MPTSSPLTRSSSSTVYLPLQQRRHHQVVHPSISLSVGNQTQFLHLSISSPMDLVWNIWPEWKKTGPRQVWRWMWRGTRAPSPPSEQGPRIAPATKSVWNWWLVETWWTSNRVSHPSPDKPLSARPPCTSLDPSMPLPNTQSQCARAEERRRARHLATTRCPTWRASCTRTTLEIQRGATSLIQRMRRGSLHSQGVSGCEGEARVWEFFQTPCRLRLLALFTPPAKID